MELTREEVERIIRDTVAATVTAQGAHPCGLSEEAAREVPHFYGMIKDAGGGDYARGVEAVRAGVRFATEMQSMTASDDWREDMRFVRKWRQACEKTGNVVLCSIVLAVLGLLGVIGGMGWWAFIERGGK